MKATILILFQLLFFILISIVTLLLNEYLFIKQISYFVLITGITFFIYRYFIKVEYLLKGYLINLVSLFLLFELKKFIGYSYELISPKYSEVIFISMLLSFTAIAIYLGILVLIAYLARKLRKVK